MNKKKWCLQYMSRYEHYIYDARGNGEGGVSPTLTGDHQNRITDYTAIVLELVYEDTETEGADGCE